MKTDVKINVHIISAVIQAVHNVLARNVLRMIFCLARNVLRLIFIDALIRFKIFFLIIWMFMLILKIEMT